MTRLPSTRIFSGPHAACETHLRTLGFVADTNGWHDADGRVAFVDGAGAEFVVLVVLPRRGREEVLSGVAE